METKLSNLNISKKETQKLWKNDLKKILLHYSFIHDNFNGEINIQINCGGIRSLRSAEIHN